jgi:hypothetical protein
MPLGSRRNWLANYRASFLVMKVQRAGLSDTVIECRRLSLSAHDFRLRRLNEAPARQSWRGSHCARRATHLILSATDPLARTIGRQIASLAKLNFLKLLKLIWVVQTVLEKYSAFHFPQISGFLSPSRLERRGAYRDRHERGGGVRWTRRVMRRVTLLRLCQRFDGPRPAKPLLTAEVRLRTKAVGEDGSRTAKPCGPGAPTLALSFAKTLTRLAGDGGKKARFTEESTE